MPYQSKQDKNRAQSQESKSISDNIRGTGVRGAEDVLDLGQKGEVVSVLGGRG